MGSYDPERAAEAPGVTAQLSHWISNLQLSDVPVEVRERAKYQLLDGVACAIVGAHVPWSEKYVEATAEYEPAGDYSVTGWDKVCLNLKFCSEAFLNRSLILEIRPTGCINDERSIHPGNRT